ncbi:putative 4-hydroxy-2-oxovalerate aldolase (plasmid) [Sinorhizobium fredii NGR234]|uniref:4-hydroxy-2-oxovalerate aldolase n=1 Tax=Sinorhizobium fredii (strain NBRC 101917 / NGR234) TaxID=394 RepID=Q6W1I7_SINFN|nr:aldolase/citrate lyase family protein [Sinorhizobium fredii]AAQ87381.1 4-hydroxy-2-oxovalerate aldolase [Sinorhizobium fredii NGR234]ACP21919.1 putative 4-hydroxy-2-oxovalerate aldolase [Sinorhizobium fredii NGR234]
MERTLTFKERTRARELTVGTWIKTPSRIVTEVLSGSAMDVLCLDAEHAPFDRMDLDGAILSARAQDMPVLVRVQAPFPTEILNALDLGATGVVIPHVYDAAKTRELVSSCLYAPGGRGYAGSSRAAGYTRVKMADHIMASNKMTTIIAQLEDAEVLSTLDELMAIEEIDCFFIGRADLAVGLGASSAVAPEVIDASTMICETAAKRGKAVGMFVPDLAEIPRWNQLGVSLYLLESDQAFLINGASRLKHAVYQASGL